MQKETIRQLIADKNKDIERATLREAEHVIERIAEQQGVIEKAQERITELRKELHALEIKQLNVTSILGQE